MASAACGSGSSGNSAAAAQLAGTAEPKLGVNVSTIAYWDGSRPFANLIYGGDWAMQAAGGSQEVPAGSLDANGWVKSLPNGYHVQRVLSIPSASADVLCRWEGNDHGSMSVGSDGVTSSISKPHANQLKFHYASTYPTGKFAVLSFTVDPSNYVHNIDCREVAAPPAEKFDPAFIATIRGFRVIRFMKWQTAVEANSRVTWATRNKPADGTFGKSDGVPVEFMVDLANEVGADPWFTIPWNADDDYVRQFAAYVRDHLAPGRQAYVETSNEVWNGSYPVMHQAQDEGTAEGLDSSQGPYGQAIYRYAEKTQHVMQIWSSVFAGQMNRVVRVASAQHVNPFWSERMMGYGKLAESVDALATAPYWGFGDSDYSGQPLDQIMGKILPQRINEALDLAVQQKAIARKYGKRYIAYEAGQGVLMNNSQAVVAEIERDPRMADLYKSFIGGWNSKVGDTLTLFTLTAPLAGAGFGLVEYAGQPLEQTPKMRAARNFLH
ncbi:MAG: hypothetical protein ACJ8FS_04395 [Sphingomicrobium sp.]